MLYQGTKASNLNGKRKSQAVEILDQSLEDCWRTCGSQYSPNEQKRDEGQSWNDGYPVLRTASLSQENGTLNGWNAGRTLATKVLYKECSIMY